MQTMSKIVIGSVENDQPSYTFWDGVATLLQLSAIPNLFLLNYDKMNEIPAELKPKQVTGLKSAKETPVETKLKFVKEYCDLLNAKLQIVEKAKPGKNQVILDPLAGDRTYVVLMNFGFQDSMRTIFDESVAKMTEQFTEEMHQYLQKCAELIGQSEENYQQLPEVPIFPSIVPIYQLFYDLYSAEGLCFGFQVKIFDESATATYLKDQNYTQILHMFNLTNQQIANASAPKPDDLFEYIYNPYVEGVERIKPQDIIQLPPKEEEGDAKKKKTQTKRAKKIEGPYAGLFNPDGGLNVNKLVVFLRDKQTVSQQKYDQTIQLLPIVDLHGMGKHFNWNKIIDGLPKAATITQKEEKQFVNQNKDKVSDVTISTQLLKQVVYPALCQFSSSPEKYSEFKKNIKAFYISDAAFDPSYRNGQDFVLKHLQYVQIEKIIAQELDLNCLPEVADKKQPKPAKGQVIIEQSIVACQVGIYEDRFCYLYEFLRQNDYQQLQAERNIFAVLQQRLSQKVLYLNDLNVYQKQLDDLSYENQNRLGCIMEAMIMQLEVTCLELIKIEIKPPSQPTTGRAGSNLAKRADSAKKLAGKKGQVEQKEYLPTQLPKVPPNIFDVTSRDTGAFLNCQIYTEAPEPIDEDLVKAMDGCIPGSYSKSAHRLTHEVNVQYDGSQLVFTEIKNPVVVQQQEASQKFLQNVINHEIQGYEWLQQRVSFDVERRRRLREAEKQRLHDERLAVRAKEEQQAKEKQEQEALAAQLAAKTQKKTEKKEKLDAKQLQEQEILRKQQEEEKKQLELKELQDRYEKEDQDEVNLFQKMDDDAKQLEFQFENQFFANFMREVNSQQCLQLSSAALKFLTIDSQNNFMGTDTKIYELNVSQDRLRFSGSYDHIFRLFEDNVFNIYNIIPSYVVWFNNYCKLNLEIQSCQHIQKRYFTPKLVLRADHYMDTEQPFYPCELDALNVACGVVQPVHFQLTQPRNILQLLDTRFGTCQTNVVFSEQVVGSVPNRLLAVMTSDLNNVPIKTVPTKIILNSLNLPDYELPIESLAPPTDRQPTKIQERFCTILDQLGVNNVMQNLASKKLSHYVVSPQIGICQMHLKGGQENIEQLYEFAVKDLTKEYTKDEILALAIELNIAEQLNIKVPMPDPNKKVSQKEQDGQQQAEWRRHKKLLQDYQEIVKAELQKRKEFISRENLKPVFSKRCTNAQFSAAFESFGVNLFYENNNEVHVFYNAQAKEVVMDRKRQTFKFMKHFSNVSLLQLSTDSEFNALIQLYIDKHCKDIYQKKLFYFVIIIEFSKKEFRLSIKYQTTRGQPFNDQSLYNFNISDFASELKHLNNDFPEPLSGTKTLQTKLQLQAKSIQARIKNEDIKNDEICQISKQIILPQTASRSRTMYYYHEERNVFQLGSFNKAIDQIDFIKLLEIPSKQVDFVNQFFFSNVAKGIHTHEQQINSELSSQTIRSIKEVVLRDCNKNCVFLSMPFGLNILLNEEGNINIILNSVSSCDFFSLESEQVRFLVGDNIELGFQEDFVFSGSLDVTSFKDSKDIKDLTLMNYNQLPDSLYLYYLKRPTIVSKRLQLSLAQPIAADTGCCRACDPFQFMPNIYQIFHNQERLPKSLFAFIDGMHEQHAEVENEPEFQGIKLDLRLFYQSNVQSPQIGNCFIVSCSDQQTLTGICMNNLLVIQDKYLRGYDECLVALLLQVPRFKPLYVIDVYVKRCYTDSNVEVINNIYDNPEREPGANKKMENTLFQRHFKNVNFTKETDQHQVEVRLQYYDKNNQANYWQTTEGQQFKTYPYSQLKQIEQDAKDKGDVDIQPEYNSQLEYYRALAFQMQDWTSDFAGLNPEFKQMFDFFAMEQPNNTGNLVKKILENYTKKSIPKTIRQTASLVIEHPERPEYQEAQSLYKVVKESQQILLNQSVQDGCSLAFKNSDYIARGQLRTTKVAGVTGQDRRRLLTKPILIEVVLTFDQIEKLYNDSIAYRSQKIQNLLGKSQTGKQKETFNIYQVVYLKNIGVESLHVKQIKSNTNSSVKHFLIKNLRACGIPAGLTMKAEVQLELNYRLIMDQKEVLGEQDVYEITDAILLKTEEEIISIPIYIIVGRQAGVDIYQNAQQQLTQAEVKDIYRQEAENYKQSIQEFESNMEEVVDQQDNQEREEEMVEANQPFQQPPDDAPQEVIINETDVQDPVQQDEPVEVQQNPQENPQDRLIVTGSQSCLNGNYSLTDEKHVDAPEEP